MYPILDYNSPTNLGNYKSDRLPLEFNLPISTVYSIYNTYTVQCNYFSYLPIILFAYLHHSAYYTQFNNL